MSKFQEDTLTNWALPPSDSEETKLANAERMIREALRIDPVLSRLTYEVFGQGSYANDTNVRLNSDVDINVRLLSTVHIDVPAGKTIQDYGYTPHNYNFSQYKREVFDALGRHFGITEVQDSNKCIKIRGNSYRVQADVVPTFGLHQYWENGSSRTAGSWFLSNDGQIHTNYAKQRNNSTSHF